MLIERVRFLLWRPVSPPYGIVFIDFLNLKWLLVHSLVHSCFLDRALFPSMRRDPVLRRISSVSHRRGPFRCSPRGLLRARVARSSGDKLGQGPGHVVRRLRPARQRRPSEMDPAEASPVAAGPDWRRVSNCFAAKRCLRTKSSGMGAGRLLPAGRANQTVGKRA